MDNPKTRTLFFFMVGLLFGLAMIQIDAWSFAIIRQVMFSSFFTASCLIGTIVYLVFYLKTASPIGQFLGGLSISWGFFYFTLDLVLARTVVTTYIPSLVGSGLTLWLVLICLVRLLVPPNPSSQR